MKLDWKALFGQCEVNINGLTDSSQKVVRTSILLHRFESSLHPSCMPSLLSTKTRVVPSFVVVAISSFTIAAIFVGFHICLWVIFDGQDCMYSSDVCNLGPLLIEKYVDSICILLSKLPTVLV